MKFPENVLRMISVIEQSGEQAYAVGGCVRDTLMNRMPEDWDICTSASPQTVCRIFSAYPVIETGLRHGTVTVVMEGNAYEITTFRTESTYSDHRRPDAVRFVTDIETDLSRRDFTVNAMAYNPRTGLIDVFGGEKDIYDKVIRAVGDARLRFEEDALRIMRCLRFACTLDFEIDAQTEQAVHEKKQLLNKVSQERITAEFLKLLCGKAPGNYLLRYPDVMRCILPEFSQIEQVSQNHPYHCHDLLHHTAAAMDAAEKELDVRLAVFFHDFGKAAVKTTDENGIDHFYNHPAESCRMAERIMKRMRMSNEMVNRVKTLVEYHDYSLTVQGSSLKRVLNRIGGELAQKLVQVQMADIAAQSPELYESRYENLLRVREKIGEILEKQQCFQVSMLEIDGNDLKRLGYQGRPIGEILNDVLVKVMDNRLDNDKKAIISYVKKEFPKGGAPAGSGEQKL